MKKIPTLFRRDPANLRAVLPECTPGCEWVFAGAGVATRKYDGTCLRLTPDGQWWARREVKPGKEPPSAFVEVDHDPVTDKRVGWEPIEQTGWVKYLGEAVGIGTWEPGTYELCGPKINRNPENYLRHTLVRHADAEVDGPLSGVPLDFATVRDRVRLLGEPALCHNPWEGIVWHHPDGRMAKLKARDFQ